MQIEHFVIGSLAVETEQAIAIEQVAVAMAVVFVVVELVKLEAVEFQMGQQWMWHYFGIAFD